jgi:hypothetical protein
MKYVRLFFACTILCAATAGSGFVHGRMSSRWGTSDSLVQAAERLKEPLPARLGPWRLVDAPELDERARRVLQAAGSLQAVYTNDQTSDTMVATIVAGPSGPISAHIPEICYAGSDYLTQGEREETKLDVEGQSHSFWKIHALSQHANRPNLVVFYAWSAGEGWRSPAGPRFAFAGLPVLYKLQLATVPRDERRGQTSDAFTDFASRLLTHLKPRLVKSSRLTSLTN